MANLNIEALVFCLAWVLLAAAGWLLGGWASGLALSVGLFPVIALSSGITLSRTGNFALERGIRWGILIAAAIVLFSFADLQPSPSL